jgi:hypothetical protein
MKKLVVTGALLLIAQALTLAQGADHQYRGEGYLFIGEGTYPTHPGLLGVGHVGGGGGVLLFKGLGVESELGAMGRPGDGVGLFSVDPSYRLLPSRSKSKVVPFVEGGYTRAFGNWGFTYSENLFNFGGGIHYWPFKRVGMRLEGRDYVDHGWFVSNHYPALRIALALR